MLTTTIVMLFFLYKHKKSENALKKSELELNAIYSNAPLVMLLLDEERQIVKINTQGLAMARKRLDEATGRRGGDVLNCLYAHENPDGCGHGKACEECGLRNIVKATFDTGKPFHGYETSFRYQLPDDSVPMTILVSTTPLEIENRKMALVSIQDTTERKRIEEELRQSEKRLRAVVTSMPVMLDAFDDKHNIIEWNDECEKVTGYKAHEITTNTKALEVLYPDAKYREWVLDTIKSKKGDFRNVEFTVKCKDGTDRIISWSNISTSVPIKGWSTWAIGVDITGLKRSEEALRESEAHFRSLFESMNTGAIVVSAVNNGNSFIIDDINCAALNYIEKDQADIKGNILASVFPKFIEYGITQSVRDVYSSGQSVHIPTMNYTDDAISLWMEINLYLLPTRQVVMLFDDRSDQRLLEEQLRQSEKMKAVGQLAGGVAHDFNNQLTGILGYSELLMQCIEDPQKVKYLQYIIKSAKSSANLIQQLMAFSRKGQYQKITLNIHSTIQEAIDILKHSIDKKIKIIQKLDAPMSYINGDTSQIQNCWLNLGINARDAMPEGGVLVFETKVVTLDEDYCRSMPFKILPGKYICVSVVDSGTGMEESILAHIYEPFYTTKEVGKGTGMGLAAVYGTVKYHSGAIEAYSEVGNGTKFSIYLPLEKEKVHSEQLFTDIPVAGTGKIIIVDDEEVVRNLGVDILSGLGYTVTSFSSGTAAVEYYSKEWEKTDLVIIDIIMPEMNGQDTYMAMKKINPDLKVLLSSGYSKSSAVNELIGLGANGFIGKPFDHLELSRKVSGILNINES